MGLENERSIPEEFQGKDLPANLRQVLMNPYRRDTNDYTSSEMEYVYKEAQPQNWEDILGWLIQFGADNDELSPGEAAHMLIDVRKMIQEDEPFPENPDEATDVAKGMRGKKEHIWHRH